MQSLASDIARSFSIHATKLKSALSEDKQFYWFYVSLHLRRKEDAPIAFTDIALVEYHLRHSSFPEPNVRVTNPENGFEYKFWLYGFVAVDANVVLRSGDVITLPLTRLRWDVTDEELRLNGRRELSW